MENKLKPIIDYKNRFPYGVKAVFSINAREIISVTINKYSASIKDPNKKNWCIKFALKNGNDIFANVSTEEKALEAQTIINNMYANLRTLLYVINTKSSKEEFISDVITNNSRIVEEAIKYLD